MKNQRLLFVVPTLSLLLSLAACRTAEQPTPPETPEPFMTAEPTAERAGAGGVQAGVTAETALFLDAAPSANPIPAAGSPEPALQPTDSPQPEETALLRIEGDGMRGAADYRLSDLMAMHDGYAEQVFSEVSNWPLRTFAAAKGIRLDWLLREAGLLEEASSFRITTADGEIFTYTRAQLLGTQYYYPAVESCSADGAAEVFPMLAWAFAENSTELSTANPIGGLRLMLGQNGVSSVNTSASLQNVTSIIVSTADPGQWSEPSFSVAGGKVRLYHDSMDRVKIYYTTDGSVPGPASSLYNPSTSTLQPDLIAPFPVEPGTVVRVCAIGYGRCDSEIAEFSYAP